MNQFYLKKQFEPAGDQPKAIEDLINGLEKNLKYQTLLGITGSGKTYTMANVIAKTNRPALIIAHNKTLAAQLYAEFRDFFPQNAVEYFVSYYDYYQPESYVPHKDLYIEKDASINKYIEQMRLSATKAILERTDVVIVATVSAIYGIGDVNHYQNMVLHIKEGSKYSMQDIVSQLVKMQYKRAEADFDRGTFRVRGENIDVFPAENSILALRISLLDDKIEGIYLFDHLTGKIEKRVSRFTVFPSSHYVVPLDVVEGACVPIEEELERRVSEFKSLGKEIEAYRIQQRTNFDLEMLKEIGFCKGIENYSRHLTGRKAGTAPPTLIDYMPANSILFIDESHVTVSQIGAMYSGDRVRKKNLIDYGFRLPSALDNRPLNFDEFIAKTPQTIFVSATPGDYELTHQQNIVEQIVRPTGLLDPELFVRPVDSQIDDLMHEIRGCVHNNQRVLVTTLTKKMSEKLSGYYGETGIKVRYLHSEINTVERAEIIRDLRLGAFDVLIGVNLLREGLDMPEVGLVAILDADKEGFLRSERSLIQTIGRAARNIHGRAILYANKITPSMQRAIDETKRRRETQIKYNLDNNIIPRTITKPVSEIIDGVHNDNYKDKQKINPDILTNSSQKDLIKMLDKFEKKMNKHAQKLEFEEAARCRDHIQQIKNALLELFS